jgi:FkbM family methyltransferase
MRQIVKGKYKFFARHYPEFHDEWVIDEIFGNCYRLEPEMFTGLPIIDIGANVGDFSVFASEYGKVYAYEPEPHNYQMLVMNVALNKDIVKNEIITINKGIGAKGTFTINNNSGSATVGLGDQVCECIDLNEALKDFKEVDLVKFDIEGSEYELFENATEETLKKIRHITGELHSWRWDDEVRHQALLDKLNKYFICERWGFVDSNIAGKSRFCD